MLAFRRAATRVVELTDMLLLSLIAVTAGRTGPLRFAVAMAGPAPQEARNLVEQVVGQVQGMLPESLELGVTIVKAEAKRPGRTAIRLRLLVPSMPPSDPAPFRHLGSGGPRPLPTPMIMMLIAVVVVVALPIYLYRRPKPITPIDGDAGVRADYSDEGPRRERAPPWASDAGNVREDDAR